MIAGRTLGENPEVCTWYTNVSNKIEIKQWFNNDTFQILIVSLLHLGVVVITTTQLHSTEPELKFCTGLNSACSVPEIQNGEDLWQWSQLEMRLNAFWHWTKP